MAATLDEVSGGRFVLGIGAGWNEPEFEAFGLPFDMRVSRFEEALQIIRPLLREGHVDFKGEFYQAVNCEITPRGPRAEGPPLLVGGFGPRMLRLAARYADMWNTGYLDRSSALAEPLAKMAIACDEVGRALSTLAVTSEVSLGYPDLGELPQFMERYLTGSSAEVAKAIDAFRQAGAQHLMFRIEPFTAEAFDRFATSFKMYRRQTAAQ
jgi:alkanesulfonate monooxygenase SsuD/methylene tetrahydromethanopterin reductase-like flavin-dependent oxidoreductase (luciferase family)